VILSNDIQRIIKEGTGLRVLSRREIGQAQRAIKEKQVEFTSFWNRKRRRMAQQISEVEKQASIQHNNNNTK